MNDRHKACHYKIRDSERVAEMTHMVMGPTCGMILGDPGAEVIKGRFYLQNGTPRELHLKWLNQCSTFGVQFNVRTIVSCDGVHRQSALINTWRSG